MNNFLRLKCKYVTKIKIYIEFYMSIMRKKTIVGKSGGDKIKKNNNRANKY